MKKKFLFAASLIIAAVLVYTGCKKDDDGVSVSSIWVSPVDTIVSHNKTTIKYTCVVNYDDGSSIDGTEQVDWSSSDVTTATISNSAGTKGLLTTQGSGITLISAYLGGVTGPATLEVLGERAEAINDYKDNYLGSELTNLGWTGNEIGCIAGDISTDAHNKVIQRINYFRRVCGLSDNVTLDITQIHACQECALVMKANNDLSHYINSSWKCYTPEASDAALHSNIALGIHSVNAVTGYIEDPPPGNETVGHRAWILLQGLTAMGDGSTDNSNAIMWKDNYNPPAPSDPEYVAYPPDGYIASSLVFPRWFFMIKDADFNNATIEMDGNDITNQVIKRVDQPGYTPYNRIVWEPTGINTNSPNDVKYTITIANIGNASQTSYTYEVTIFKAPTAKTGYEKIKEQKIPFEIR